MVLSTLNLPCTKTLSKEILFFSWEFACRFVPFLSSLSARQRVKEPIAKSQQLLLVQGYTVYALSRSPRDTKIKRGSNLCYDINRRTRGVPLAMAGTLVVVVVVVVVVVEVVVVLGTSETSGGWSPKGSSFSPDGFLKPLPFLEGFCRLVSCFNVVRRQTLGTVGDHVFRRASVEVKNRNTSTIV